MASRFISGGRLGAVIAATVAYLVVLSVVAGFPEEANAAASGGARGAAGGHGETDAESAWNEVDGGAPGEDLDVCARYPEVAEICAACPSLVPESGVTAWRCCVDPAVHEACAGAAAIVSRALTDVIDETGTGSADKRAKYFLGKRAKYFLGKRAFGFGARRAGANTHYGGAFRASTRQQMMADGLEAAADKRAKYFLGK